MRVNPSLALGGPHGAVTVRVLTLDHGRPQIALASIVRGLDPSRKGDESQKLGARAAHAVLDVARQVADGRSGEDVVERAFQLAALGGHRRGRRRGDGPRQGEGAVEPQLEPQGQGVVTRVERVDDVTGEVRQTGLLPVGMSLLGGIAVRQPHGRPVPVHDLVHHACAP